MMERITRYLVEASFEIRGYESDNIVGTLRLLCKLQLLMYKGAFLRKQRFID